MTLVSNGVPSYQANARAPAADVRDAAKDIERSILMARAQAGDQAAYRRLLEDITPYVRTIAARRLRDPQDVEDAVQDVLLTVHLIRHTYDPGRPFVPWLAAIANRRVIDQLRRVMRSSARQVALTPEHETFAASQTNIEEATSDGELLRRAIGSLSAGQRQAVEMLKLKEMSLKDAAATSGMSIASLKVAMHRALKSLQKALTKEGENS
ncbi:MAG: sigma-70 family RNA polymerase sigma factor [Nitrospiraceae bacterium]